MSIKHGIQYAKIIAIVDKNTGELHSYRWSIARENHDYFADPEDRKKYLAVTVKHLQCESISELKAKFEMARDYLKADFLPMLKGTVQGRYNPKQLRYINRVGMMKWERISLVRKIRASPLAHGEEFEEPELLVNSNPKAVQYELDDHVLLAAVDECKWWVRIESLHDDVMIGRDIEPSITSTGPSWVWQFSKEHVFAHRSAKAMNQKRRHRSMQKLRKRLMKAMRNRQQNPPQEPSCSYSQDNPTISPDIASCP